MVCPKRKNKMICRIMQDKRNKKEENKIKQKEITEEEHQKRLKTLKDIGIIK